MHPEQNKQGNLLSADLVDNLRALTLSNGFTNGHFDNQDFIVKGKQIANNLFGGAAGSEGERGASRNRLVQ